MADVSVLSNLNGVSDENYTQAEAYIRQLLEEGHPDRNFNIGTTFYWNQVVPNAQAAGVHLTNADIVVASMYLKSIRDQEAFMNEDLVELTLSNYYVERGEAVNSAGNITVVVNTRSNYVVPAGTLYNANGFQYQTTENYYVYTQEGQVQLSNDRLLFERSDGNYQYTIPIEAVLAGTGPFLRQGSELTAVSTTPEIVRITAASDIDGGADEEDFAELVNRVPETLAAQTFGSRNSIAALIEDNFPNTKTAVTGMGDEEMQRDTHNKEGVSTGGMADVFVVTQESIGSSSLILEGELVDSANKIWKVTIPDADVAGIYNATGARPEGSTENYVPITETERGYWIPAGDYQPYIFNGAEAAFSPYQRITVYFVDTITNHANLSNGDKQDYDVLVQSMPLVKDISDFLTAADRVDPATNVLVRGAIPCTVDISMVIRLLDGDFEEDIDVTGLKSALVSRIYDLGFDYGVLSVSNIMEIAHDFISGRSDVGGTTVTMRGQIIAPTGDILNFSDGQEIVIPQRGDIQVSPKTTVFLTDSSRIEVEFTRVEA